MKRLIFLLLLVFTFPTFAEQGSSYSSQGYSSHQFGGDGKGYVNQDGQHVHVPEQSASQPDEATAQCRDGSWSFSRHRRGTCSHHGGVARWL